MVLTDPKPARGAGPDERQARGVLSEKPVHLLHGVGWRAVWAVSHEAVLRLWDDDAMGLAGNIAFRALLALFPFLIFATSLTALLADKAMADGLITFLITLVPSALVEPLIAEARDVLSAERGGVLSLGGLLTLWFALGGVGGVRVGLNRAYDIREGRSAVVLLTLEVVSVITLGFGFVLVGYLLVLAPHAGSFLHRLLPGFEPASLELGILCYLVSAAILAAALFAAHVVLPARRLSFATMWPGILFTLVAWSALGAAFSLYLIRFADYASYYAGLAGIVAGLYFLYLAALVLIFGGELNRVLRMRRIARALRRT
ncbi:Inner membrane protein YihY, formerly thought to be RNase BN [Rubellimicrobium mesophilum DSM 19309]|uniref:Inner membrane protein YihY, formerly thought to be RNase BN n=1 Tax=Rubellimicrobium mesophilum DSM 19309 TaxID=442562 RepID=A0A017HQ85_9RHOB|nr:YihY/virulence factor BrkB family protein [Rubellimicrobium mesophilum]EYD76338.1 Inner membrane protein YihY, formerly thought to be RNase BN [Rubellimicrobium mesophilum DSM 19309]